MKVVKKIHDKYYVLGNSIFEGSKKSPNLIEIMDM